MLFKAKATLRVVGYETGENLKYYTDSKLFESPLSASPTRLFCLASRIFLIPWAPF